MTGPADADGPHRASIPAPRALAVAPRLRPVTAQDRALIEDLVLDDPAYTRTSFDQLPSIRDVDAILDGGPGNAGSGAHQVLGAFSEDGVLLGVAQAVHRWPSTVSCYLGLLQVRPAHRGRGLGATLLAATEDTARARGCRQVLLSVIARNRSGRAFWHHHGFLLLHPQAARAAAPLSPLLMHKPL
ncbi:GNAT family N-acetyltransferase [Kocuria sp. SM24M-10]|uniref:GNAT family N-acetyltransferase n=1 Tax=Kocuria sp. SM24M-10 TaxID=1660349 RepID=UPI0006994034|nr:GNAT family N-acetyltransferase [Kocuria sp. SM24M-10]